MRIWVSRPDEMNMKWCYIRRQPLAVDEPNKLRLTYVFPYAGSVSSVFRHLIFLVLLIIFHLFVYAHWFQSFRNKSDRDEFIVFIFCSSVALIIVVFGASHSSFGWFVEIAINPHYYYFFCLISSIEFSFVLFNSKFAYLCTWLELLRSFHSQNPLKTVEWLISM